MLKTNSTLSLICLLSIAVLMLGCQSSKSPKMRGAIEVRNEKITGPLPVKKPNIIYVKDFALDVEHYEVDEGIKGRISGRLTGRLGQDLPHPIQKTNPEQQVDKIVTEMSQSLISGLKDKGFNAQRVSDISAVRDGWLLQGGFTEVDEGNRLKRATIGFGQGATQMEIQVGLSDLASVNPQEPFVVFGTIKDPKKMPGAVVTMNPYVAAAKFVLEKNATTKDIQKTSEQIVGQILKYSENIKE